MLSREIMSTPVAIITMALGAGFPQVRYIGKVTTFMQSIAFPLIILSIFYPFFSFSWYLAVVTGCIGFVAGIYYIYDMVKLASKKLKQKASS